jgi:hypothetical protein
LAHDLSRWRDLDKGFILATFKAYAEALVVSEPNIEQLTALYAIISRMRVISSLAPSGLC